MSQPTDPDPNYRPPSSTATLPMMTPNGKIFSPTPAAAIHYRAMIRLYLGFVAEYERLAGAKTTTKQMRDWYKKQQT